MWRFRIDAEPDPQTLPRIAGYFAQLSLVPSQMTMRVDDDRMGIEIVLNGIDRHRAEIVAAKLGETFLVASVTLDQPRRRTRSAPPVPRKLSGTSRAAA